jgi:hypothetical protein
MHFGYSGFLGRNVSSGDLYLLSNLYLNDSGAWIAVTTDETCYVRLFEDQINFFHSASTASGASPSFTEVFRTKIDRLDSYVEHYFTGRATPATDDAINLGTSALRWNTMYLNPPTGSSFDVHMNTSTYNLLRVTSSIAFKNTPIYDHGVDALALVNKMKPLEFEYDDQPGEKQFGLTVEDLIGSMQELSHRKNVDRWLGILYTYDEETDEHKPEGISSMFLRTLAFGAIQQLSAKNDQLLQRVIDLEQQIRTR